MIMLIGGRTSIVPIFIYGANINFEKDKCADYLYNIGSTLDDPKGLGNNVFGHLPHPETTSNPFLIPRPWSRH